LRGRLVLAASLVLVAVFLVRWWLPGERPSTVLPSLPDTRFDYTLSDFSARFYNAEGELSLLLDGPRLEHDSATRIASLVSPSFRFDPEGRDWHGQALSGQFDRDADALSLIGEVILHQQLEQGRLVIETERLQHQRAARTISGDQPVSLRQPGTQARAGGLMIRLDEDTIELHEHIHAQMQTVGPGRRPAGAGREPGG
jgi:LPS export ABC transporter protein LptC